jgi:3',5'-cyclic AMP phosphodiesterase CpdA
MPNDRKPEGDGYTVKDSNMHHDVRPLLKLLSRSNVKLCLSGHMHQVDEVDYMGMKFCCNGAVSGNWWKGAYMECPEGYAVIDLHADGRVENRYVTYGWEAKA